MNLPIFIVNLAKDTEKKEYMDKLCRQNFLKYEFIDAIYGRDLSDEDIKNVYDKPKTISILKRELAPGEIGCALSHMAIYKKMVDKQIEIAIIFEDDITIAADYKNVINSIDQFPTNWDCVLLGHYPDGAAKMETLYSFWEQIKITDISKLVRLIPPIYGTHGYIINLKGAKKLLDAMNPLTKPIDHFTNDDLIVNLYGITPPVIRLQEVYSQNSSISQERQDMRNKYIKSPKQSFNTSSIKRFVSKTGFFQIAKLFAKIYRSIVRHTKEFFKRIQMPHKYDIIK